MRTMFVNVVFFLFSVKKTSAKMRRLAGPKMSEPSVHPEFYERIGIAGELRGLFVSTTTDKTSGKYGVHLLLKSACER